MYEDKKYAPLSAWAYFGYELLFSLPVAGLVLLIVFSFSNKNINRRNFARAHFCAFAAVLILCAALAVLTVITGVSGKLIGEAGSFLSRFAKIF